MRALTILGSNRYLIDRALTEQKARFEADNGPMSIENLDVAEMTADQVVSYLASQSLFNDRRLIMIHGLSQNPDLVSAADRILDHDYTAAEIVIIEPDLDRRTRLYSQLKDKTKLQQCDFPDENTLIGWLVKEADSLGVTLSRDLARYLIDKTGTDQLRLNNELIKLSLYAKTIDRTVIDVLVEASPQSTTFDLLDATFDSDRRKVSRIYAEQRALKIDPQQIIGLLAWQLHLLACLKTAGHNDVEQIAGDTGISVYAVKKSRPVANRLSLVQLKDAIARLERIDCLAKQAPINLDDALLFYLISF